MLDDTNIFKIKMKSFFEWKMNTPTYVKLKCRWQKSDGTIFQDGLTGIVIEQNCDIYLIRFSNGLDQSFHRTWFEVISEPPSILNYVKLKCDWCSAEGQIFEEGLTGTIIKQCSNPDVYLIHFSNGLEQSFHRTWFEVISELPTIWPNDLLAALR
jgi:hypothetical protein